MKFKNLYILQITGILFLAVILHEGCNTPGSDSKSAVFSDPSPFGIFGPFEYQHDDATVATDEDIIAYLVDLDAPWVQEVYFFDAVLKIPQSINIYTRVGLEVGPIPEASCLATDDPAWIQYEHDYAAALRPKIIEWKSRIQYFEVATEPSGFWPPLGYKDCEQNYVDHLKVTYTVIKEECPECKVVYGGLSGVNTGFDENSSPAQFLDKTLAAGAADYFDVFEFKQHWHRAIDYPELRNKYQVYTAIFAKYGLYLDRIPVFIETAMYDGDPCKDWIDSQCADSFDLPYQTESEQAAGLIKTYVYGMASGIDRIFWNLTIERYNFNDNPSDIFNCYGLINNPRNDGNSHKKLAYFSLKKLIEVLKGSDWTNIQIIQEAENLNIYKFIKNGSTLYVIWWDYFNDATYSTGNTIPLSLSGLEGESVIITETVPNFATGSEVTDYTTAFRQETHSIVNGTVVFNIGDRPVFIEISP